MLEEPSRIVNTNTAVQNARDVVYGPKLFRPFPGRLNGLQSCRSYHGYRYHNSKWSGCRPLGRAIPE